MQRVDLLGLHPHKFFNLDSPLSPIDFNSNRSNQETPQTMQLNAKNQIVSAALVALCCGAMLLGAGCATPAQTAGLAVGLTAAVGGVAPAQELEQTYYLGVFDPEEQLPPAMYRLTVRGQASFLSGMKFASGWVPAGLIDSLNTTISGTTDGSGGLQLSQPPTNQAVSLATGRRLTLFGPEGFRQAPRDYRLVVVMGADPQAFFGAIDRALGAISGVAVERGNVELQKKLFEALVTSSSSSQNLSRLKREVAEALPRRPQP